MSYESDEHYAVYDEKFPAARKVHICDACNDPIRIGDTYTRVGIVYNGSGESVKRCMRCQRIHEHLRGLAPGETWPRERLNCGADYEDEWGREPPEEIQALAFALPGEIKR